ncbi:MAG: GH32 C-terminal domain-containing protein [Bacteroidaceae bacterium]
MKRSFQAAALASALCFTSCSPKQSGLSIEQRGDTTVVTITNPTKYLILPIEENQPEAHMLLDNGQATDTWMDIRLAISETNYEVPFELTPGRQAVVKILGLPQDASALKGMRLSDTWEVENTDYYRPLYHHTPAYGWMNDPNGMVYKDGEYHLFYQYNPYGSKWGNMHWGHSVSTDMIHWERLAPAIPRDTLGHIFSGSCIVDKYNSAGYGKDAIIAFYTSASDKNGQIQCMAYSVDNGHTFTKYDQNPVLTPFDGLRDFRDPKVFWYEPAKAWYMIVSANKNMRFYRSTNLKQWEYLSQWGEGYGAQPNMFECPDFFPLTINGQQKWVMIVNINPGCIFGGSATEYFVGGFDGTRFTCDDAPEMAKFLDYGKDHYAAVTFSNTGDRIVAIPWMSNWQYANDTPNRQVRGSNGLPRELKLFESQGTLYLSANVVEEAKSLRQEKKTISSIEADCTVADALSGNNGACEIEMDVTPGKDNRATISLCNDKGEHLDILFDTAEGRVVMNRNESGKVDFGGNTRNDFCVPTWAPLSLCASDTYHVDIFVDKSSVELFVEGGRIAMTNQVFPTVPYNNLRLEADNKQATFKNINIHTLQQ